MSVVITALSVHTAMYRGYPTQIPWDTFVVTNSLVLAIGVAFAFVLYGACCGFVLTFFPESVAAMQAPRRRALAMDALLLVLAAFGMWHFCHQLAAVMADRFPAVAILNIGNPQLIGLPVPALGAIAGAIRSIFS